MIQRRHKVSSHAADSRYAAIAKRWADKNPNDIALYGEMPDWRTIVQDIHTLLKLPIDLDEVAQEHYDMGYQDGLSDGEDRAWEDAWTEGYETAQRENKSVK